VEVRGLARGLEEMFREQVFCSAPCVRAHCLEMLSVLDSLDTPSAERVVTDLREVYAHLARALSRIRADT
jgi:hypothetical protein